MRLAIISPNQEQYSETFIQFHRTRIPADIYYLFGGFLPVESEDGQYRYPLDKRNSRINRIWKILLPGFLSPHEKALAAYLKKNRIDAVLAEYGMTGVAVQAVCEKLKIPLFIHFHGYDATNRLVVDPLKAKYRNMFRAASGVFVVSKHMMRMVEELGCPPAKMILNHYGPADHFFSIHPNYSSKAFLSVGRFVEKKAPELTIKAFFEVNKEFPDSVLYMVGSGERLESCMALVKSLGITQSVHFCGVQNSEGIASLMQKVGIFVQHSVTAANGDSEGTPVAILEAAAAGLPVVSTRHAGIPDVILDGETGLLCEEHDLDTMISNMRKMLANPEMANAMGEKSRSRIATAFTLERHIQCIFDSINSVVKVKSGTAS
ncbi:MAG: glycosyltransferase [Flavipsychrobacter sp.]|nr:glycosyltransferase [Flavipsychrobacter sp.]